MKIAIDGPAGSGKSTVAKLLAEELDFQYIDTGAMYRAVTFAWMQKKYPNPNTCGSGLTDEEHDENLLKEVLANFDFKFEKSKVFLNDKDLSEDIRKNIISQNVSYIASFAVVRNALVKLQRKLGESCNVILDGRDIGTVVFPDAELKIFLTASPEIRAKRREKELLEKGEQVDFEKLLEEIKERDHQDSTRDISPLKKADNALEILTDGMAIQEVVTEISKKTGLLK